MIDLHQRSSGVLLHLTSLPGPFGVGDFGPGAYQFVDWLVSAGQTFWQWLPINPIGPGNSPYQSVSAFAGSPLMVALEPLIAAGWLPPPTLPEGGFDAGRVDFERVVPWRLAQLRQAARGFFATASAAEHAAFAHWCADQASWLDDYTLFMALEEAHDGAAWWFWRSDMRDRVPAALDAARAEFADEIRFWQFVQWCFDQQASALKAYANQHAVSLMGDLPIFIAHHSADCWARPDLYFLDDQFQPTVVAGCPPDAMAPTGQRWGNPLYRWERMAAERYAWWTARLRRALHQADVFRIDHFRGFAGYYAIPASCPTGFPGMKILQFAFDGDARNEFLPHNYTRHCVAYTGTHDNDTVRGWWHKASPRERAYARRYLAPGAIDVHWAMILACWNSVANIAVAPLQDVLGLDSKHRMNIPGTMGGHNWTWRFRWDMVGDETARVLGFITAASGRGPAELMEAAHAEGEAIA